MKSKKSFVGNGEPSTISCDVRNSNVTFAETAPPLTMNHSSVQKFAGSVHCSEVLPPVLFLKLRGKVGIVASAESGRGHS